MWLTMGIPVWHLPCQCLTLEITFLLPGHWFGRGDVQHFVDCVVDIIRVIWVWEASSFLGSFAVGIRDV